MKNQWRIVVLVVILLICVIINFRQKTVEPDVVYKPGKTETDFRKAKHKNEPAAYDDFLLKHPGSRFQDRAVYNRSKLIYENAKKIKTSKAFQDFLDKNSKSTWASNFRYYRDKYALEEAEAIGTPEALKAFIDKYPDSDWVDSADSSYKNAKAFGNLNVIKSKYDHNPESITKKLLNTRAGNGSFDPDQDVPTGFFLASYFNSKNPGTIILREVVEDVSIHYAYDDLKSIDSQDFAGYWKGEIEIKKRVVKQISINQGRSKTRLKIDSKLVYEGEDSEEILFTFEPGMHDIEVEYINNWHTTEFSLRITDKTDYLGLDALSNQIADISKGECKLNYTGVYESSNVDLSINITLKKETEPVILFFNSYSPVKWMITNPHNVDIRAIIYRSHSPGTVIQGKFSENTRLLATKAKIGDVLYRVYPKCSCDAGRFHCEGDDRFLSTKEAVESVTGHTISGFTGKYSAASFLIPDMVVDKQFLKKLADVTRQNKIMKDTCVQEKNPDFDDVFAPVKKQ